MFFSAVSFSFCSVMCLFHFCRIFFSVYISFNIFIWLLFAYFDMIFAVKIHATNAFTIRCNSLLLVKFASFHFVCIFFRTTFFCTGDGNAAYIFPYFHISMINWAAWCEQKDQHKRYWIRSAARKEKKYCFLRNFIVNGHLFYEHIPDFDESLQVCFIDRGIKSYTFACNENTFEKWVEIGNILPAIRCNK